ncbi:17874_t:CDS:2 [Funneliformis geosporum]|nr:17874_t:CDS:2 [Funneliformis geosporum]
MHVLVSEEQIVTPLWSCQRDQASNFLEPTKRHVADRLKALPSSIPIHNSLRNS